jgi:outer membrane protein OmpA-like peptidoglycan-associated protein
LFLKLVINDNKQNRFCLDNTKITLIFENQIFNLNFYLPSVLHPPLNLAVASYFVCAVKKLLKPKIEFRCSPRKNNSYMAHLEVKPKSGAPWWLWLLLALIALAIILFFVNRNNSASDVADTRDSTGMVMDQGDMGGDTLATTEPSWNSVDFNSAESSDPNITDKDIRVRSSDGYTIYSLGENILFATDQSAIQSNSEAKLKQISSALNKDFQGAYVGVFGNTDSTGTASHNKQLGMERATAVKDWLVSQGGIDQSKVSVHSRGENAPVADNASASGKNQNRNVEIVVFRNK